MNNEKRSNKKPYFSALVKASKSNSKDLLIKPAWMCLFPEPYRTKLNAITSWWDHDGSRVYCTAMEFLEGAFPWDESPNGRGFWEGLCEEIRAAVEAEKNGVVNEPVKDVPPSPVPSPFKVGSPESRSVFNEELTAFSKLPQESKDILERHRRHSEHYDFGGGGWAVRTDDYKGTHYYDTGVYRYIAEGAVAPSPSPSPSPKAKADPIPVPKPETIEYVYWKVVQPKPTIVPRGCEYRSEDGKGGFLWKKEWRVDASGWDLYERRWPKQQQQQQQTQELQARVDGQEVQKVTPVKSPAPTEADIPFHEIPLEVDDEGFICGRLPGKLFKFRLTELMSHEKFMGIVYQHGENLKAVCVRMRK